MGGVRRESEWGGGGRWLDGVEEGGGGKSSEGIKLATSLAR